MNKRIKLLILLLIPLALLAVSGLVFDQIELTQRDRLALLVENNAIKPFAFPSRTKTEGCKVRGPLPDPDCTPGSVFPGIEEDIICIKGYTKSVRNVSVNLKKKMYESYGFSYPQPPDAFEADHLIPLELGGDNEIENLFPESALPKPGFREKDLVENYLNDEVCAGRISLIAAQQQIARDWVTVYNNLTTNQIEELKNEFRNY